MIAPLMYDSAIAAVLSCVGPNLACPLSGLLVIIYRFWCLAAVLALRSRHTPYAQLRATGLEHRASRDLLVTQNTDHNGGAEVRGDQGILSSLVRQIRGNQGAGQ